jgi:hypothetical protein
MTIALLTFVLYAAVPVLLAWIAIRTSARAARRHMDYYAQVLELLKSIA